jgi:plasmid maintenance system killer protein
VIGGFRHKGLEAIYLTGKTRRIGADHVRKCVRIVQLPEIARPPATLVGARNRELPDHVRLARRQRLGCRF